MGKKTDFSIFDKIETVLQPGTVLDGVLSFSKPLKVRGKFSGEIESEAVLYIDDDAEINADISARVVIISGKVNGNVSAKERIEILSGGKVSGDLISSRIRIADGVEFNGRCRMIKDPETIDIFSAGVDKLKEIARSI
ncbi:MAG: polymer-forming cytoskeletal protein [Spirochaetales bacterium]|uniref:Polymer-forming cytoskeletal protein n=1 Tax=Candidatus Thalassospirochaeta sargassi TaxID=3119039 RepID=A0AAJ1MM80_9SPIO|nr:polymer-forming cytoskeletal protein [Spirochaetales bacterium]